METKLTLKLNRETIEQAKKYARQNDLSLSKMVEKYFESLNNNLDKNNNTKLVHELSGIIKINEKIDYKDERMNRLVEKYK